MCLDFPTRPLAEGRTGRKKGRIANWQYAPTGSAFRGYFSFVLSAEAPHDAALQPQAVLVRATEMRVQIISLRAKRNVPS